MVQAAITRVLRTDTAAPDTTDIHVSRSERFYRQVSGVRRILCAVTLELEEKIATTGNVNRHTADVCGDNDAYMAVLHPQGPSADHPEEQLHRWKANEPFVWLDKEYTVTDLLRRQIEITKRMIKEDGGATTAAQSMYQQLAQLSKAYLDGVLLEVNGDSALFLKARAGVIGFFLAASGNTAAQRLGLGLANEFKDMRAIVAFCDLHNDTARLRDYLVKYRGEGICDEMFQLFEANGRVYDMVMFARDLDFVNERRSVVLRNTPAVAWLDQVLRSDYVGAGQTLAAACELDGHVRPPNEVREVEESTAMAPPPMALTLKRKRQMLSLAKLALAAACGGNACETHGGEKPLQDRVNAQLYVVMAQESIPAEAHVRLLVLYCFVVWLHVSFHGCLHLVVVAFNFSEPVLALK